jgi:predicted MFS family arabinose efflux permease
MKEDLLLSDTQLGFLTGIAFGLFYATVGLPIARWADRGDRSTIAALAIGSWGITLMATVFVRNYAQLVLARIAAAVGEAGCMPPTYSLIGSYFREPAERARALATYMLAGSIAALISFAIGGVLNERFGWRLTFFMMGVPGLVVALLVKLTVRDPRTDAVATQTSSAAKPRMVDVLNTLWRRKSSRHLIFAFVLLFTMGSGLAPWYGAFLIRSHGMSTAELGVWLAVTLGGGGIAGICLGGYISARWLAANERAQMRTCAVLNVLMVPGLIVFLLLPGAHQALLTLFPLVVASTFFAGPAYALMQRLVPDEMRATALAVMMLLANLLGTGIGPQVVGVLSDSLVPTFGPDSLRYAMVAMSFVSLWAAYHFWQVSHTVEADLSRPRDTD